MGILVKVVSNIDLSPQRMRTEISRAVITSLENRVAIMANEAPVDTGHLRDTISGSFSPVPGQVNQKVNFAYAETPYLWRQNFEHSTKSYYITRNIPKALDDIALEVSKVKF